MQLHTNAKEILPRCSKENSTVEVWQKRGSAMFWVKKQCKFHIAQSCRSQTAWESQICEKQCQCPPAWKRCLFQMQNSWLVAMDCQTNHQKLKSQASSSSLKGIGIYLGRSYHLRIYRRCLQAKQLWPEWLADPRVQGAPHHLQSSPQLPLGTRGRDWRACGGGGWWWTVSAVYRDCNSWIICWSKTSKSQMAHDCKLRFPARSMVSPGIARKIAIFKTEVCHDSVPTRFVMWLKPKANKIFKASYDWEFTCNKPAKKKQKLPQLHFDQPKPRFLSHKQPKQISPKTLWGSNQTEPTSNKFRVSILVWVEPNVSPDTLHRNHQNRIIYF